MGLYSHEYCILISISIMLGKAQPERQHIERNGFLKSSFSEISQKCIGFKFSYKTLGKVCRLSELQFSHLYNGNNYICHLRVSDMKVQWVNLKGCGV